MALRYGIGAHLLTLANWTKVQLEAARLITGLPRFAKTEAFYLELGLMCLQERRKRRKLCLFYKIKNDLDPDYLHSTNTHSHYCQREDRLQVKKFFGLHWSFLSTRKYQKVLYSVQISCMQWTSSNYVRIKTHIHPLKVHLKVHYRTKTKQRPCLST
jgi:hypothetical protein